MTHQGDSLPLPGDLDEQEMALVYFQVVLTPRDERNCRIAFVYELEDLWLDLRMLNIESVGVRHLRLGSRRIFNLVRCTD